MKFLLSTSITGGIVARSSIAGTGCCIARARCLIVGTGCVIAGTGSVVAGARSIVARGRSFGCVVAVIAVLKF